ncbi:MAG: HAMP domain-containing histidine kinase [Acidimicrobiales bacterium]|nr:HAMP domain-containing histidine kinase [Acidimicrobiales bacterium]
MTFRSRLMLATTAAVLVVVVVGSVATYLVASHSLISSTDATLTQSAHVAGQLQLPTITNVCVETPAGQCQQVVFPDGQPVGGSGSLPVTNEVHEVAASGGTHAPIYFSTDVGGVSVREIAYPLPPGFTFQVPGSPIELQNGGALQLTTPLTGVNHELRHLAYALWAVIVAGVVLALLLGYAVGRTLFRPLNSLTETVEDLAETTDVSQRLDPGGHDELGRLRRAFNSLLAALDSSRESQRQLVLDASHELRTPLTSLRTNLEVARRMDELSEEERDILISDVLTQLDELTSLVGAITELARGEQPAVESRPFRLDAVVMDAVGAATTHGRARGVVFDAHVSPTWVRGTSARVERAVDNLLDNALKWSPDGGVVEVTCADGELVVRDHGPGVDEDDVPYIFDRFYRAPSARGRPGSGLGLAIVAQVARDDGGSVTVDEADGGGALFRFTLPVVTAPHPAAAGDGHEPAPTTV